MKKLLNILTFTGLITILSTNLVSCSNLKQYDNKTNYSIHNYSNQVYENTNDGYLLKKAIFTEMASWVNVSE